MAKYGPSSVVVEYDNAGGVLQNISQHVQEINDIDVENIVEEVHTLGDTMEEWLGIGVGKVATIELSGLYDDGVAPAPDALFANRIPEGPSVATRTLKITFGGTKTFSVETVLKNYRRKVDRNAMTRWAAILQPTGAVTET
jgi:hypothetical protein